MVEQARLVEQQAPLVEQEPIYSTDWTKYKKIRCLIDCLIVESDAKKNFHTCPFLMEIKKKLERLVRKCRTNSELYHHFRTDFRNRKVDFYQKILYLIIKDNSEIESQVCELTKDILFIYSKKKEELEYLDYLSNDFEARESHEQEYRESLIEQFRGCD
jgi:hypothetical protein